jgi:hypothetical protein
MDVQAILVLKQALDSQKLQGRAALQLIQAAQPVRGAPEPGKGAQVDVFA